MFMGNSCFLQEKAPLEAGLMVLVRLAKLIAGKIGKVERYDGQQQVLR